jgi:hypothetical protein
VSMSWWGSSQRTIALRTNPSSDSSTDDGRGGQTGGWSAEGRSGGSDSATTTFFRLRASQSAIVRLGRARGPADP